MARSRQKPKLPDPNVTAYNIVQAIAGEIPAAPAAEASGKDPAAVALGRKGGLKGGKVRAAKLTAEQRRESARKAARARWAKHKGA